MRGGAVKSSFGRKRAKITGVNSFLAPSITSATSRLIGNLLSENTNAEMNVRDLPVESKYLAVWHRAFAKIKSRMMLRNFHADINLFGTGIGGDDDEMGVVKKLSV
jgi:hypothetical protein